MLTNLACLEHFIDLEKAHAAGTLSYIYTHMGLKTYAESDQNMRTIHWYDYDDAILGRISSRTVYFIIGLVYFSSIKLKIGIFNIKY